MNRKALHQANIDNLTSLWKCMASNAFKVKSAHMLHAASAPTNRLWFDWASQPQPEDIDVLIKKAIENTRHCTIPTWGQKSDRLAKTLHSRGLEIAFEQTAMVLSLKEIKNSTLSTTRVRPVKTTQEMQVWAEVASQVFGEFGESISVPLVQRMTANKHMHLIMAWHNKEAAGTGLIYEAHGVSGIHYIGILPAYRRRGIARQIMKHLIHLIRMRHCEYATLQASEMAEDLYRQLGFTRQFTISNFWK
ncbi:MAG: GNAT family N-acetyltransferase [Nitrospirae bacterium]|nr:GNAT family N-acetyltransferase [Candidatus Manganitrophaceae bacterium]